MKKLTGFLILFSIAQLGLAQFDPAAGKPGSKAIHRDSSALIDWATECTVVRGWKDIAMKDSGKADHGTVTNATSKGDGAAISLGDSGVATLTFNTPLSNGNGADFAVFENSFSDEFLELAFVEVSSDGSRFVRFPAISNVDTVSQIDAFGSTDPTLLYNFAGKYRVHYGVPFDLEELKDSQGLDVSAITHVRIVDAIGSLDPNYASRDSKGNKINDPYPTLFSSGGFDLDAVGVIHNQNNTNTLNDELNARLRVYPTALNSGGALNIKGLYTGEYNLMITNVFGKQILSLRISGDTSITLPSPLSGAYILRITDLNTNSISTRKMIVR